eukprot:jgi/Picsp_1/5049/NSC_02412-R1_---NA---
MIQDDFGQSPLGTSKAAKTLSEISEEDIKKGRKIDFGNDGARSSLNNGAPGCPERVTMDTGDSEKLGGGMVLTGNLYEAKEDDIYGDLYTMEGGSMREGSSLLQIRVSKLTQELNTKNLVLEKTQDHLKELQIEIGRLQEENKILEQNISCLFNTAKLELERKDKELKRFQEEWFRQSQALPRKK